MHKKYDNVFIAYGLHSLTILSGTCPGRSHSKRATRGKYCNRLVYRYLCLANKAKCFVSLALSVMTNSAALINVISMLSQKEYMYKFMYPLNLAFYLILQIDGLIILVKTTVCINRQHALIIPRVWPNNHFHERERDQWGVHASEPESPVSTERILMLVFCHGFIVIYDITAIV